MRRILFRYRGLTVWSYPAMLYVGLVVGVVAGNLRAHTEGVDPFRTYAATLILIVPALLGSRLLYIAANWQYYRRNIPRIWDRNDGGAAMFGGFALALVLSVPLLAALKLALGAFWDVAIVTILIGMIFTRIGCFLNGCCAGRPSKIWGMHLPNHLGVWENRIPTQLLEGLWTLVLLTFAVVLRSRLPFPGALFLLVTAGYSFGRLLLESLREAEPGARRLNLYHAMSAVMLILSLVVLAARWHA